MKKLLDGEQRLSHISKDLDLTLSESSRHLQRLSDAKLIKKDSNGLYLLTSFGENVLSQLQGLDFVSRNSDYFNDHIMSTLPYEFLNRIGELNNSVRSSHLFKGLELVKNAVEGTQKQMWILSDKIFNLFSSTVNQKLSPKLDCRLILPANEMPSDNEAIVPSTAPGVNKRTLPSVEFMILVFDNNAGFTSKRQDERMDYGAGFQSRDPISYKWCKDLFLYYWDKAEPLALI
jgi:predicted transcriptional regulator